MAADDKTIRYADEINALRAEVAELREELAGETRLKRALADKVYSTERELAEARAAMEDWRERLADALSISEYHRSAAEQDAARLAMRMRTHREDPDSRLACDCWNELDEAALAAHEERVGGVP